MNQMNKTVYVISRYTRADRTYARHHIDTFGQPLCGARTSHTYGYDDTPCDCKNCLRMRPNQDESGSAFDLGREDALNQAESMQSSDNTSYCVNILGLRAVCPFYALPQEWESFRADQWAYVEFLTESDQHMRGSTAWIPYSLANKESNSHE